MISKTLFATKEDIRKATGYTHGDIIYCQQSQFAYTFNADSVADEDDDVTLRPHDTQTGRWVKSGIIQSPLQLTAAPAASAALRGVIVFVPGVEEVEADALADPPVVGVSATADQVILCYKQDNDVYAWVSLVPAGE